MHQLSLGNLFVAAGYRVIKVEAIQHKWPPNYVETFAKYGEEGFHRICRKNTIKNYIYQIRIIASKDSNILNIIFSDFIRMDNDLVIIEKKQCFPIL